MKNIGVTKHQIKNILFYSLKGEFFSYYEIQSNTTGESGMASVLETLESRFMLIKQKDRAEVVTSSQIV